MSLQVELNDKNLAQVDHKIARLPYVQDSYTFKRRKTREVMVGDIGVGGDNPIRVQSMTTADTMDTEATVAEAVRMVEVGCEIVRITTPQVKDAENLKNIREGLKRKGIRVPIVADIHFSPNAAMEAAKWADKVRINPGNFADAKKFAVLEYTDLEYQRELERIEARFKPLVLLCKERGVSMRIGTNHGSLSDRIMNRFGDTPEGMVESALEFALIADKYNYHDLIFSMKASNPKVMVQAYRLLAARLDAMGFNYPFHLGVTEAGNAEDGRIKSAIGIGSLLEDGIGDTIRVSLTEDPEREIPVALRIARRYTPIDQKLLDLSDIHDSLPVPTASEWILPNLQTTSATLPDKRDPYHYAKVEAIDVALEGAALGGENVPQVIAVLPEAKKNELLHKAHGAGRSLIMATQPKRKPEGEPDIYLYPLGDDQAISELKDLRKGAGVPFPVLVPVSTLNQAQIALQNDADALSFVATLPLEVDTIKSELQAIAHASGQSHRPVWLKVESTDAKTELEAMQNHDYASVQTLLRMVEICQEQGQDKLVLALGAATTAYLVRAYRLLASLMQQKGWKYPIHLTAPTAFASTHTDDITIDASIAIGGLLIDGIGNSIEINYPAETQVDTLGQSQLAFNILQAAGTRSSKAEYIACPSCGRTLFDLQSTTERIKARTKHLVGVKIAIMGCIVNGLGELADADFGYMGGAVGKVNLFVGKECVEKGVPTATADERLIELIKKHGRWIDPE